MSKIICEICGTSYPETSTQCPICGCVKPMDKSVVIDKEIQAGSTYTYVKGGRFSKRNVKKLIESIHNAGGIAVLAHPACYWAINLETLIKKLM